MHMHDLHDLCGLQMRKREEAADHTSADMARKLAALDQKDRPASEKEASLSSLTAELWAKVPSSPPSSLCCAAVISGICSSCLHFPV